MMILHISQVIGRLSLQSAHLIRFGESVLSVCMFKKFSFQFWMEESAVMPIEGDIPAKNL